MVIRMLRRGETQRTMTEENNKQQVTPEVEADSTIVIDETNETVEDISSKDVEVLRNELVECLSKSNEYLDGWQRARAEFANYKKRIERDRAQVYKIAAGSIIKRYLDIIDDIELALKKRPQEVEGAAWADGIELIYRKLSGILEAEGVECMDVEGQLFDPNLHEAISSEEIEDYESGQIIEVIKQGYMLEDRVLRPALVRVAM